MRICEVHNLSKRFGSTYALREVSFQLPQGISIFLGPNGSGKSTCIKLLAGLIRPSEGKANLLGYNPWEEREELMKHVRVVLENTSLPRRATGLQVAIYLVDLRNTKWEEMVRSFKMFGVESFVRRELATYSAGMYQRFILATAFVGQPQLIMLDEPTQALDPTGRKVFFDALEKHVNNGNSVIISTHVLTDLPIVASHAVFFKEGKILESDNLSHLLQKYRLRTVRFKARNVERVVTRLRSDCHIDRFRIEDDQIVASSPDADTLLSYLRDFEPGEISDISELPPDYLTIYKTIEQQVR